MILAGGMSRRFGSDKTLAPFRGSTVIGTTADNLVQSGFRTYIVAKDIEKYSGIPVEGRILDGNAQQCPMTGVITALENVSEPVFIVSADSPMVNGFTAEGMFEYIEGYDAVIPDVEGKVHPLHGVYAPSALGVLRRFFNDGNFRMFQALKDMNVCWLGDDYFARFEGGTRVLGNINTEEDMGKLLGN